MHTGMAQMEIMLCGLFTVQFTCQCKPMSESFKMRNIAIGQRSVGHNLKIIGRLEKVVDNYKNL